MILLAAALLACSGGADTGDAAAPEPLVLPAEPDARGVPVGVRTVRTDTLVMEIFYPAPDAAADDPTEIADLDQFIPESVTDVIGPIALPQLDPGMVRDAALRVPVQPYPVVLFSHGFGGFRLQSLDLVVQLASWGFVVVAVDHPGRMLGDVLPCVFTPPLEGCTLSFTEDPGEVDIPRALDWLQGAAVDGFLAGGIDLDRVALAGHSAGAGTTASVGNADDRFAALLPMAAAVGVTRDVPALAMGGACDFVADGDALVAAWEASVDGTRLVVLEGAGHLVFTDLCALDMGTVADQLLAPRDDINQALLDQLMQLAVDGCPGATPTVSRPECQDGFADLALGQRIVRAHATTFLSVTLAGQGGQAVPADLVDGATVY